MCYNIRMTVDEFGQLLDKKLDEKLQPINDRLDGMEQRLGNIEKNMATKEELHQVEKRIMKTIESNTKTIVTHLLHNQKRIERLEDHVGLQPPN